MDQRIEESKNSRAFYEKRVESELERVPFLEAMKSISAVQFNPILDWSAKTLALLDITDGPASEKLKIARVGARLGTAVWASAYLGEDPEVEILGNTVELTGSLHPDDLLWIDTFRLAQIAHATAQIELLTAPIDDGPEPERYDRFFSHMRQGLSAHVRGDGQGAADGYIAALEDADPDRDDLHMDPNALLDLHVPTLELWDAIFRRDPERLHAKLEKACKLHREYYRRNGLLKQPDSFVSRSAWAARSWAHRLGWDIELDHPVLPEVLPTEGS